MVALKPHKHNLMPEDSLKKRYLYKLSTNLVGLIISMATQVIIPRGLGPKAYGDFNFLSNFFSQIIGFFDMGTSVAFYTKLSKRPQESRLVSFYLYFMGIVFLGTIGFVFLSMSTSAHARLWPSQAVLYIYLAAIWGGLNWATMVLSNMTDAYGLTVSSEIVKVLQKLLGLLLIVVLYFFNKLTLTNYFLYNYFIYIFLGAALIWIVSKSGILADYNYQLPFTEVKRYFNEFYQYSHPLIVYALVGLIAGILDRWLLQVYAGSIQQGYFGLSYQIGALCFLFTSAMTPLLLREFSIAYSSKDLTQMAVHFRRYIPMLYSIAAYFACFIAVQADRVVYMFGGNSYKEAGAAVAIMAFYPIHQTYGQLSGSVFYASGQTVLYRNIGIIFMIIGLPVTYFLIAPAEKLGLNSGATGLSIKMVLLQFIAVNVQLYFNARLLKLSFYRYLGHQVLSVGCLLAIAAIASIIVSQMSILSGKMIMNFIAAGMVYTFMVALMIYFVPATFGLRRDDIRSGMEYMLNKFQH